MKNDEDYLSGSMQLQENEKIKLGRKKLNFIKNGKHNKFYDNNIINKIKEKIFKLFYKGYH